MSVENSGPYVDAAGRPLGNGVAGLTADTPDALVVNGCEIAVSGTLLRTACLREEWDVDVEDPGELVAALKRSRARVDVFTFMQRLPESWPKHAYHMEWDNVAAIPLTTFEAWWQNQVRPNLRNKLRKSQKEGLAIRRVAFGDQFVLAVMRVLNECPVRQGRAFSDYGKAFDVVKSEHATFLERADFFGAYSGDELIGYLKLVDAGRFTRTMQVLSMIKHRNKAATNALMAEAVKLCCERKSPYLVYGKYSYGKAGSDTLREFKAQNGFEHILLPRYYVPLTSLGAAALKCRCHHGAVGVLPKTAVTLLLAARRKWYAKPEHDSVSR